MAILIRRDQGDPLKWNPLEDGAMEEVLPSTWNGPHVGKRVAEAFGVLARLPLGGRGGGSAWPAYSYEWSDLLAQQEQEEAEKAVNARAQNFARVAPSVEEVSRMEKALYWPAHYLIARPDLLAAVNWVSLAHSLGREVGWVARKRGGYADTWRARWAGGCDEIAAGLTADRVAVF